MHIKCHIICWIVILLFVAGCDPIGHLPFGQNGDSQPGLDSIILADVDGFNREDWENDPYHLEAASIAGDTLQLTVSYSGGCEAHEFQLVAWNYPLAALAIRADVLLAHDANGDACEALITEDLRFDLSPLKRVYQRLFGDANHLFVNLRDGNRDDGALLYNLSMEGKVPQAVQVGEPFEISVGNTVILEPEGLQIVFESVTQDSRCPTGAVCVWEGEAEIRLDLTSASGQNAHLLLTIPGLVFTPHLSGESVEGFGHPFKLLQLSPHPHVDRPQPAEERYRATLLVEN